LLLYLRSVKLAEGKSINGEHVAVVLVQPPAEGVERSWLAQLPRGKVAQAQPNGVGSVGADPLPHRERVMLQRSKRLRPVVAPMDVRAVREVNVILSRMAYH